MVKKRFSKFENVQFNIAKTKTKAPRELFYTVFFRLLRRYCVPARTFLGVSDRSAFTVPDSLHEHLHDRFWPFLNDPWGFSAVLWEFSTVWDLITTRKAQKRSWNGEKRRGTLDAQERSRMVRNGERYKSKGTLYISWSSFYF